MRQQSTEHPEGSVPLAGSSTRQPRPLAILFLTEMWERYGYYTMRAVFVLYLTKVFLLSDTKAYAMFATFSALAFLTPLFGGMVADRVLGFRRSVLLGGVLLAAGYAMLGLSGDGPLFHAALGAVIVGNGFFKPNVSGIVGQLYGAGDPRREGGFTIFYAGINVGSVLPPLITGWVILRHGWHAAFLMAAAGVFLGTVIFAAGLRGHPELGAPSEPRTGRRPGRLTGTVVALGTLASVLLSGLLTRSPRGADLLLLLVGGAVFAGSLARSMRFEAVQRSRLIGIHAMILISLVFWALYQQAGMSLTLFTEYNVGRTVGAWTVPTIMLQSVNPFLVLLLAPAASRLWLHLETKGRNPSIPAKFALGTILMGAGFLLLLLAIRSADSSGRIGLGWVVASYALQTTGELLISPVGLSMISRLTPAGMVGLVMGLWFFATALGNTLAGWISEWTALPSGSNDPLLTDPAFAHVFGGTGAAAIFAGALFLVFSAHLDRLLEGRRNERSAG